jgi:cobalt-zinc-cadmium efflux system outer membrane protein
MERKTGKHEGSCEPAMSEQCQSWTAPSWFVLFACGGAIMLGAGCAAPPARCDNGCVARELIARTTQAPLPCVPPGGFVLPPDAVLEDGVSEDEAIATALSNNAVFQAALAQLDMACGDVVQAGLLANPNFQTFLPVGVKQWEWTLFVPIESFILRPHRLAATQGEYGRVANQLVQNGLTLVRDVRVAYADWLLAEEQARLGQEGASIRQGIANLTERRLQRGDIGELEAMTARIDALNAQANAALLQQNVIVARSRVAALMGLPPEMDAIFPVIMPPRMLPPLETPALVSQALALRPDMFAAQWAVDAAAERARLARWQFVRLDVGADANSRGLKGYEAGPALRFDVPIFHRNQGGIVRADAELDQALHNRDAIRNQIVQEVRTAAAQAQQAQENLEILQNRVAPALQEALAIAQNAYETGGASYLLVLQTTTQYLDARVRILDQTAALRRATAELERGVGRNLAEVPLPPPGPWDGSAPPGPTREELPVPMPH